MTTKQKYDALEVDHLMHELELVTVVGVVVLFLLLIVKV